MARNAAALRSSDTLLQVAGFLKQADKLVRERNYSLALEQIAKAREKDPTNSYAEAYEQRVKLLMSAISDRKQAQSGPVLHSPNPPRSFTQHLENIADLAIQEAQRTASISLQQSLAEQLRESQTSSQVPVARTTGSGKESVDSKEEQICRHINRAEVLLGEKKLDEALNTLMPAILLDPLNATVLAVERKIHEAHEQRWLMQVRESHGDEEPPERVARPKEKEIQQCIVRAIDLSERKHFSEALTVVGQGYLLDPFNASLAVCERTILAAIARDSDVSLIQEAKKPSVERDESTWPKRNRRVHQLLDKAESFLNEDHLSEALTQVCLGIIALQVEEDAEERSTIPPPQTGEHVLERKNLFLADEPPDPAVDRIAHQICELTDGAKKYAGRGEFNVALGELLKASYLIPTDGSLWELDREIAKKFLDYYQLMKASEVPQTFDVGLTPAPVVQSPHQREPSLDTGRSPESGARIPSVRHEPAKPPERQLEFEMRSSHVVDDRVSQIRGHLLRALHHLKTMKLVEASVEGEIAGLLDSSRGDVTSFAAAVAGLARRVKAQVPLSSLGDAYEAIRQQARNLIYALWYEELLNGIDRVLECFPSSHSLQRRKMEAALSFEELKRSNRGDSATGSAPFDALAKNRSGIKKARRRPFDQIGMSFSVDPDQSVESSGDPSADDEQRSDTVPLRRQPRRSSAASTGSAYSEN